jgi:putative ABC transport system permease protein
LRDAITRVAASSLNTELLLTQVPQLIEAGTLGTQIRPVEAGTTSGFLRVSTPSFDFLEAFPSVLGGFKIASGTTFTNSVENQVVVGARSAGVLQLNVGSSLSINGIPFTVVGILEPGGQEPETEGDSDGALSGQGLAQNLGSGNSADLVLRGLTNTDDSLFVLYERASVLTGGAMMSVTIARVEAGASISDTKDAINVAIGQQGASGTPISIQEVADEIQGTLGLIQTVLASIAAVALLVGGVGLMNTMYTAVLERTREIGILKSVGARDGQVMILFLIDSGLMGLIGGTLGLLLGSVLSLFGTRLLGPGLGVGSFAPIISGWLISGVLVFSFVLGALSGVWPAWRASRLHPVDALAAE